MLFSLVITAKAGTTTAEDVYFVARDAAIATIKAANKPAGPVDPVLKTVTDLDGQARAALERKMRAIVGPVAIKGFPGPPKLNLDTLIDSDEGFGLLDGVVYGDVDAKTRVIVTTDSVFRHWLHEHKNWLGEQYAPLPQDPAAAVTTQDFYTQAVLTDAAILRYADLPIRKPAGAEFAYVMLAARTQSKAPAKAGEIFLVLEQGGRVFIAYTGEFEPVGPIAECDAIRSKLAKQAEEATTAPGLGDEARRKQSDALSAQSESEFLRCFDAHAQEQKGFAAAARAAQALLMRLPAR